MAHSRPRTLAVIAAIAAIAVAAALAGALSVFPRLYNAPVTVTREAVQPGGAAAARGTWVTGDYHNHTVLTDGAHTESEVVHRAFDTYGLDWFANSEHGGVSNRYADGRDRPKPQWRWLSLRAVSWPIIRDLRREFPSKTLVQGVEWNVPGHEHASVAIATGEPEAVSDFEYTFDADDKDTSRADASKDNTSHASAVRGAAWLQANYKDAAWLIVNHPSRALAYTVADLRDLNTAAPDVCFGFEAIPGHQKGPNRGDYATDVRSPGSSKLDAAATADARTYGGADRMLAEVGGVWDAMLGEGRHFWAFTGSDFHDESVADFWPGEYNVTHDYLKGGGPEALVASLRSGDAYVTEGGLIDELDFRARQASPTVSVATMGETLQVAKGADVVVTVRFRVPAKNANGDAPAVDHVDLIRGDVNGRIATASPAYREGRNASTGAIARFSKDSWSAGAERGGWHEVRYVLKDVRHDGYLRLRGTNLGLGVPDQTDADGDPLRDDLGGQNDAAKAWADLWFYSNPIFIDVR